MVASAYVHLPFCRGRCPYCDFASNDLRGGAPPAEYREALAAEWRWRSGALGASVRFETVYLGGGTPSLWPAAALAEMIGTLPLAEGAEVTVEANPGDANAGWYRALVAAGATRFSIGAQSVDDDRLARLGRRHDAAAAVRAIELALAAGARSVSADLIYGTPGLAPEGAAAEAAALARRGVDHLSAYELTAAPGTPLGRAVAAGGIVLPDEEALAASWEAIGAALAAEGLARYEVSSFARPGRRCRHNENYWRGGEYVGLGSGAHGFFHRGDGGTRYGNSPVLDEYLAVALGGRFPADGDGIGAGALGDVVDGEARARELVMLGLRWVEGFDLEEVGRLLPGAAPRLAELAARLERDGRALISGARVTPTPAGMLLADTLALDV